jgi:hypothetical protein
MIRDGVCEGCGKRGQRISLRRDRGMMGFYRLCAECLASLVLHKLGEVSCAP